MYIAPDSTIKLYSGIPLDNSYDNTLWFNSVSAQNSYFHSGIAKYTLTEQSYQRVVKGRMRVGIKAENLYDCNYLAFQNSSFGYKWFYAFILSVEYVNNDASEIVFEIDVMQTYLFDVTLKDSFVEREHSSTDTIGDNIIPENLELGEYLSIEEPLKFQLNDYKILVLVAQIETSNTDVAGFGPVVTYGQAPLTKVGNTIQCCSYYIYNNDHYGLVGLQALLETYSTAGKPDEILGVFMIPSILVRNNDEPTNPSLYDDEPFSKTINIEKKINDSFEGYTPRNKKLYTYPYNFLYCTNMIGTSAVYPYEFFPNTYYCGFTMYGNPTANTEIIMFPENYKGSSGVNKDEGMMLKGFPQVAYNVDTFRAWLAQNSGSIAGSLLAAAVAGIAIPAIAPVAGVGAGVSAGADGALAGLLGQVSGMTPGFAGASATGVGVFNTLAKIADHSVQPIQTRGNDTCGILSAKGMMEYTFFNKRIRGSFAQIIDEYFTMYGYATHRVKIPNQHVRERWTYVKTVGCNMVGECPADDVRKMKQIYDKGITFWVNPSEVGNYSLSNNTL